MATFNSIMKKRNAANTAWDTILPITTTENVMLSETESLDQTLAGLTGLAATQTTFGENTVTETRADGGVLVTTFNADGTISEVLTKDSIVTTRTTTFNVDGSITEVIS